MLRTSLAFAFGLAILATTSFAQTSPIVHDAEYYVLEAQNGQQWAKEEKELGQRLVELKQKHGSPPNLIHVMWDDTAYGDVGIPAIQKVRGLETPNLNKMAQEGILFTRMYTEVGCTPSRAACITGRTPNGVRCTTLGCSVRCTGFATRK